MFECLKPVAKKELRQIARDKRTLGMLLVMPVFLLIMYGYALNFDVKHLSLAVFDQEKSQRSRDFYQRFLQSEYFDLNYILKNEREIDELLGKGLIQVAMVIPPDFSRSLLSGREVSIQIILDGQEANVAGTAIGYVNAIVQSYSSEIILETMMKMGRRGSLLPVDYHPRVWFNPDLRSARFLIPGLMAFILMITVVISTSLSVVRERERGTIEQIIVSPVQPIELIIGKTIPYVLISLASSHFVLLFAYILFDVSIKGSYLYLLLGMIFFLVGGLGLGLLISTIARTQQAAFIIAVITTLLPTFILSGFVFPIRNMPWAIQVITYFIPARYFLVILRSILLKGVGLGAFWSQMVLLLLFAVLTMAVSAGRMGKVSKQE